MPPLLNLSPLSTLINSFLYGRPVKQRNVLREPIFSKSHNVDLQQQN